MAEEGEKMREKITRTRFIDSFDFDESLPLSESIGLLNHIVKVDPDAKLILKTDQFWGRILWATYNDWETEEEREKRLHEEAERKEYERLKAKFGQ